MFIECITKPSITSLVSLSSVFSLLDIHDECKGWLASSYILPFSSPGVCDYYIAGGDVFGCNPYIEYSVATTDCYKIDNIIFEIIKLLKEQYAIYTKIDCFGIFWNYHRIHDVFIVGFDTSFECLYILGPDISNNTPLWRVIKVPFRRFVEGIRNLNSCQLLVKLRFNKNCALGFDVSRMMIMVNDFLNSQFTRSQFDSYYYKTMDTFDPIEQIEMFDFFKEAHENNKNIYGIDTYDYLLEQIALVKDVHDIDFRGVKLLNERIVSMITKIDYYFAYVMSDVKKTERYDRIISIYKKLAFHSKKLIMLLLKSSLSNTSVPYNTLKSIFQTMKSEEYTGLKVFIDSI